MKKISIKAQLAVSLFAYALLLSFSDNSVGLIAKIIIASISSVFFDAAITFAKTKKPFVPESSIISGLIIGFVLQNSAQWWIFSLAALLCILSKHFIRISGKHIFNPAALGILAVTATCGTYTQWKGAYILPIIPIGAYFAYKLKKAPMVFSYYTTYIALSLVNSTLSGASIINGFLYANYFFILIMLIEPKTSPHEKPLQLWFGASAAVLVSILYTFNFFDVSPELPSLLICNVGYAVHKNKKRKQ